MTQRPILAKVNWDQQEIQNITGLTVMKVKQVYESTTKEDDLRILGANFGQELTKSKDRSLDEKIVPITN